LAEKERRLARELQEKKAIFSRWLKIGGPIMLVIFIITAIVRQPEKITPSPLNPTAATSSTTDEDRVMDKLNQLRPGDPSSSNSSSPQGLNGQLIKKDDVHFALELFNFLEPETAPPQKH
jgi:hypothetical protein